MTIFIGCFNLTVAVFNFVMAARAYRRKDWPWVCLSGGMSLLCFVAASLYLLRR
jgi:uncharacterized membrane protein HdeD (DUF308 family)